MEARHAHAFSQGFHARQPLSNDSADGYNWKRSCIRPTLPPDNRVHETFYDYMTVDAQEIRETMPYWLKNMPEGEERQWVADWNIHLWKLLHPDTKRIQMDSRQASTFDAMNEIPPDTWQRKLRPLFPRFYMEFNEPIAIGDSEPGHHDYLRALLFWDEAGAVFRDTAAETDNIEALRLIKQVLPVGEKIPYSNVTFFLDNGAPRGSDEYELIDRSFLYLLNHGLSFTKVQNTQDTADPSMVTEDYPPDGMMIAGDPMGLPNRHIGWWERSIIDYGSLLSWLFVYMMAKGIEIVVAPTTRAQRRREERKEFPKPWHIVQVEPRLVQDSLPAVEPGTRHGYRYDVMGHLRFGRHKLASGDYRETIEWVNPHQRGLANELYIPKTSKFSSGKEINPIMDRYFPKGV